MIVGEYRHSVDEKGRVFVPAKLRTELGESFFVAKGSAQCLVLYTKEIYEKKVNAYEELGENYRDIVRDFTRWSLQVAPDKQGRILIPQKLREYASIGVGATFIGMGSVVEIWDTEICDSLDGATPDDYKKINLILEEKKKGQEQR